MNIYQNLLQALQQEYETVRLMKQSNRGQVRVVQHSRSGQRFVCRHFTGSGDVYRKLIPVACPHLPHIYEVGTQDDQTLVLEEYIHGDTLAFLLSGDLFTPAQARSIILQLCSALQVLHSMDAVHRDIKPENVIMRGSEAVLIDFDASRIFKEEQADDTRILGTTGYAAPEQYGISQSDNRADIFALGVLLNIMLTGKHPSQELAPGKMGRIVEKCTMTSPKKRFRDVLHLMDAL